MVYMYPVICKIGPFTVYSYGLTLVAAFLICSALVKLQAKKQNINPGIIYNLLFIVFISGVIGARLLYIAENLNYYLKAPWEIIMLQHGGLSWFGGLTLGSVSGVVYLKKKKLAAYKIFDLIAPFLALAQAIGRLGCFLNGCCFGRAVIPIQLYSSLILLFIFIILRFLQGRPHQEGRIFFTYLLFYSFKRFFFEFWRLDNPAVFSGLTLFQLLSIIVFCIAVTKLALMRKCRNIS